MKLFRHALVAGLALAAFTTVRAENADFGKAWMSHYSESPRPDQFVTGVYSLSRNGDFEAPGQPFTAIGFLSVVFHQNPQEVAHWLSTTARILPERHQRILVAAAWLSGSPAGASAMARLDARDDDALRADVSRMMAAGPTAPVDLAVDSEGAMNLQLGAFLASGDQRHITNLFAAIGSDRPGIATSARFALAENAIAYPQVLAVCRAQLDKQPQQVRAAFEAALNDAVVHTPGA